MPKLAREYDNRNYKYAYNTRTHVRSAHQAPVRPLRPQPEIVKKRIVKRFNPVQFLAKALFAAVFGMAVLPYSYNHFTASLFINPIKNRAVKTDYQALLKPTLGYINNAYFLDKSGFFPSETEKPLMQPLFESDRMNMLELKLANLTKQFPSVKPSIYVWEYENGKFADINADELYPSASIIKIPILINMFLSIESKQFKLFDNMTMSEAYRASGSGSLQFKQQNSVYTMDSLARHMIEESDNTATNMIMAKTGGMVDVNRALRRWGMKKTYVQNWLPDLGGGNVSTAREMSAILYNINNDSLLNINSRENIIDYMSHVKNDRLIQAGLPKNAQFVHKTGDIGTMLGDAGIVYAPNGKRYIITIFAKRPFNSAAGKDFIVAASSIVYDYIVNGNV